MAFLNFLLPPNTFYLEMARHRRDDAGSTGATFYQVTLHPGNWYKWFDSNSKYDPEDPSATGTDEDPNTGWTEVANYYINHHECGMLRHTVLLNVCPSEDKGGIRGGGRTSLRSYVTIT